MVGNFAPGLVETGFMEAFMDWFLIYRTAPQVGALVEELGPEVTHEVMTDDSGQVVYLVLTRPEASPSRTLAKQPAPRKRWQPRRGDQTTRRSSIRSRSTTMRSPGPVDVWK